MSTAKPNSFRITLDPVDTFWYVTARYPGSEKYCQHSRHGSLDRALDAIRKDAANKEAA